MVESYKENSNSEKTEEEKQGVKINLHIQGRKLRDLDTFSKSDPQCTVYELKDNQWVKIGETEHIEDELNPNFTTLIPINYYFWQLQKLKFVMVDIDDDAGEKYDTIGEVETTLGSVLHAKNSTFMDRLCFQGEVKKIGVLIVRAESVE